MSGNGFIVDLKKPIVFQAAHLGDTYPDWLHTPIKTAGSLRFFESDFMETFTRTKWWVVPLIWLPIGFWFISKSYTMGHTLPQVILMFVLGSVVWIFLEPCFNILLKHIATKSYWGNTIHYLTSGRHNKHPMDGLRLVRPPAEAAILAVMVWSVYGVLFTLSTRQALLGGGLIGHVIYNMFHYYLHHGQPTTQAFKSLQKSHLNKHFKIQD